LSENRYGRLRRTKEYGFFEKVGFLQTKYKANLEFVKIC